MLVATVFEVACGVYPDGYWTLPDTAAPACKVLIAQLRAVVALKELVCWFGVHHVCRKGQSPTAWLFKGRERCWTGKKFLLWMVWFFSGMNWGREGIKNVERCLWE